MNILIYFFYQSSWVQVLEHLIIKVRIFVPSKIRRPDGGYFRWHKNYSVRWWKYLCSNKDTVRSMGNQEQELTEYGQRIDLLVSCERLNTTVELCSIEFKKEDVTASVIMKLQSKNARINSCILRYINSLNIDSDNQVLAFDSEGNSCFWYAETSAW